MCICIFPILVKNLLSTITHSRYYCICISKMNELDLAVSSTLSGKKLTCHAPLYLLTHGLYKNYCSLKLGRSFLHNKSHHHEHFVLTIQRTSTKNVLNKNRVTRTVKKGQEQVSSLHCNALNYRFTSLYHSTKRIRDVSALYFYFLSFLAILITLFLFENVFHYRKFGNFHIE